MESQFADLSRASNAPLEEQRELALACFILSSTLSVAVLWSNLGGEPPAMNETRVAVQAHRKIVEEHQALLAANQKALAEVVAARDAVARVRVSK